MTSQANMSNPQKTVLIVDDHILFREGLAGLLKATSDFIVVGEVGSVHDAVEKARILSPDIVLLDYSLPDGTGLDAIVAILPILPHCKVVFLTVYDTDENLFEALRLGASGYMLKNVASSALIMSLRGLDQGEMALSRVMMSRALKQFSKNGHLGPKEEIMAKLSPREVEILNELEAGATNQEIARHLYLSENTIKHHIRSLLEKLRVESRYQAATLVRRYGAKGKYQANGG